MLGFQYQLAFDEQRDGDVVFEDHGLKILVDGPSLPYVDGSQIDYLDQLTGAGFKVENPNVTAACGCGSSSASRTKRKSRRSETARGRRGGPGLLRRRGMRRRRSQQHPDGPAGRGAEPGPAGQGPAAAHRPDQANPAFVWSPEVRPAPAGFETARGVADALHPARFRVVLDWAGLQPDPARPADLAAHRDGCMRVGPPCSGWAGLREQLQAIASRGRDGVAPEVVVVVFGVPEWAARRPSGCERAQEAPRSRPITERGLRAYRA